RHARRVVVDEEQRRAPRPVVVDDVAVEDHEVGVRGACNEPLLAVQDVVAGGLVTDRRRRGRAGGRAGVRLRDRVAAVALATERRVEVAGPLRRVAMDERVVGTGDGAPEPARPLAELLVDDDLVERAPALAPDARREASAVEVRGDRPSLDAPDDLVGEAAAAPLERELERLGDVPGERAGAGLGPE